MDGTDLEITPPPEGHSVAHGRHLGGVALKGRPARCRAVDDPAEGERAESLEAGAQIVRDPLTASRRRHPQLDFDDGVQRLRAPYATTYRRNGGPPPVEDGEDDDRQLCDHRPRNGDETDESRQQKERSAAARENRNQRGASRDCRS